MAKKMDETEVKKECPSCGLGVALDSTVCEFCGWDFEEEDEWIVQIEKLERDLMLEKQKFEPGTVSHKIESTLHTPSTERIDIIRTRQQKEGTEILPLDKAPPLPPKPPPVKAQPTSTTTMTGMREAKPSEVVFTRGEPEVPKADAEQPAPSSAVHMEEKQPEPVAANDPPAQSTGKVRRVRTVKVSSLSDSSAKGKLVRKMKK